MPITGAVRMRSVSSVRAAGARAPQNIHRKKKSGARHGLDDGRIGLAVRAERTEDRGARDQREDHEPGEDQVALRGVGKERHAVARAPAPRTLGGSVSRLTSRPGIGHSLMPSFSTSSRCRPTSADEQAAGMTKTCSAKKRDSVSPAMIGPPSSRWTSGRR